MGKRNATYHLVFGADIRLVSGIPTNSIAMPLVIWRFSVYSRPLDRIGQSNTRDTAITNY